MTTMTERFQINAIDAEVLGAIRVSDDAGRRPRLVSRHDGGSPLRCCLRPSRRDEPVMLASYAPLRRWALERQVDAGAYDEVGPVFIHSDPCDGPDGAFPDQLFAGARVVRGYDAAGTIAGGRLVQPGESPVDVIRMTFVDPAVAVLHVRALEFGCFIFEVSRGDGLT